MTRIVVAGVALLAAFAAADALRNGLWGDGAPDPRRPAARLTSWRIDRGPPPCRSLVRDACGRYLVVGGSVERSGAPFIGPRVLAAAFPGGAHGRVEATRVADGLGGTLAVSVRDAAGRGAVELWRNERPAGAFPLSPAAFAGGLGFTPGGHLLAAFDARGRATLYDLRGNEVAVAGERRPG